MWLIYKKQRTSKKFKETGDSQHIFQNGRDKTCFQRNIAYKDFKDLTRRTGSDKVLRNKVDSFAKNPNYDRYQRCIASMI